MRVEQQHRLTMEEIKKRGEALADSLVDMPIPGGVSVGDIEREWSADRMDFSFRVSKGFFGATIKGQLLVTETTAVLDIAVPSIVSTFVDEKQIQTVIQKKMADVLRS